MTGGGGGEKEEDKGAPSQHHTCLTDTQGKNKLSKKNTLFIYLMNVWFGDDYTSMINQCGRRALAFLARERDRDPLVLLLPCNQIYFLM